MNATKVEDVKVPVTFEEAQKIDEQNSKYFKPEINKEYKLTFSSWSLYRKKVPHYKNKERLEEKTVLELNVDSLNGMPVEMEWGILSQKCRTAFELYCKLGTITKKVFYFKSTGEQSKRTYQVAEAADKETIAIKQETLKT